MKPRFAAFVVVAALPLLAGCQAKKKESAPPAKAELPADVAPLAAELKAATPDPAAPPAASTGGPIGATGEFVSPKRSELVPRWPGRVEAILAEEGDNVRQGQALLRLEADYLRLNVDRSVAELERARAAAAEARSELGRKEQLQSRGSIPQATFEKAQAAAAQADAALAAAESAVTLGKRQIADAVVVSPISGVIAERRVEVGERVADGTVTFVIVAVQPLRLRFQLAERHLAQVRAGGTVKATVEAWPGETFEGKVVMIGQVIDPATRTFAVEAEFANAERKLRPGLFARVELAGTSAGSMAGAGG